MYWRGTCATPKSAWAGRWHGPTVAIGFEGGNNVWVSHRGAAIKCSGHHVRAALPEEVIPWDDLARAQPYGPTASPPSSIPDSALPDSAHAAPIPGDTTFFDMTTAPAQQPKRKRGAAQPRKPHPRRVPTCRCS